MQAGVLAESLTQWRRGNLHVLFEYRFGSSFMAHHLISKSQESFAISSRMNWSIASSWLAQKVILPKQEQVQAPRSYPVNGTALKNRHSDPTVPRGAASSY
ncbi:hypothetical protein N7509_010709 [Penicillium cosmopolitanum]|uniref:Uncharacterized protein n=1 Tax=Penicillium cosmopolitanum TaxID=1131564 RepID=A0A9W9VRW7_9EURO|nr:uncharacterized protein N7509_010709 [Penicillium cosmopolitanum]KAJ5388168.1 hypothetical protein N7509_010709 [Penicillium cosmopolitanum]